MIFTTDNIYGGSQCKMCRAIRLLRKRIKMATAYSDSNRIDI